MLSIGDLSRQTGVKIPTIRYYETVGLVDPPERSGGNQRRYGREAVERLGFIRHARDLGLPVESIRELIALSGEPERPCADADRIIRRHLEAVRGRIARLRALEAELQRLESGCDSDAVAGCYVLRSLADQGLCGQDHR